MTCALRRLPTLLLLSSLLLAASLASPARALCVLQLDENGQLLPGDVLKPGDFESPRFLRKETPLERADRPIDVLHYDLALDVSLETVDMSGQVRIEVQPLVATDRLVFDFLNGSVNDGGIMQVTGPVLVDGAQRTYTHESDLIDIDLGTTVPAGQTLVVDIEFGGTPPRDYIMGYSLRWFPDLENPNNRDKPVVATLSEPDAARSWWPCHDHPFDAATVEVTVTCPSLYTFAGPGLRTEDVDLGNGLRRQTWNMTTPIPSYLVSLAVAEYASWEESMEVEHLLDAETGATETRTMPLQFFVPPSDSTAARFTWANLPEMIDLFAQYFGPYPFADLKYGMALFVFGGAMEHPTMSSMGHFTVSTTVDEETGAPRGEWISAHELMHQWFGDCVRVERWGEIWLNEGFARWGEAFWRELKYGPEHGKDWLLGIRFDAFGGTLVDPNVLFGSTVYNKGAWVVHMLRRTMGDAAFFEALRNYLTDPQLRFGPVNSADLQAHCEATYGESLDWFFQPWLYRAGRPALQVQSLQLGDRVEVQVSQPADRVYRLPLPVRVTTSDGSVTDYVVWVGGTNGDEAVTVTNLPVTGEVTSLEVDPERDWLIDVQRTTGVFGRRAALFEPYPNPFNPQLNIEWFVASEQRVTVEIYDLRGRKVRTLASGLHVADRYSTVWSGVDDAGKSVASGVYTVRMQTSAGVEERRKVTLIK